MLNIARFAAFAREKNRIFRARDAFEQQHGKLGYSWEKEAYGETDKPAEVDPLGAREIVLYEDMLRGCFHGAVGLLCSWGRELCYVLGTRGDYWENY